MKNKYKPGARCYMLEMKAREGTKLFADPYYELDVVVLRAYKSNLSDGTSEIIYEISTPNGVQEVAENRLFPREQSREVLE